MKWIGEIPLRWQMLIAPMLLILAILIIQTLNYIEQTRADAATSRLYEQTVRGLTDMDDADALGLDINGRMFRAMTLVQNGLRRRSYTASSMSCPGTWTCWASGWRPFSRRPRAP